MGRELTFLVSSAGRRGELVSILQQTRRDLGRAGSVACVDRSPLTAAGHLADSLDLVPSVDDPAYVDAMLEVCARRRVDHVVPTIDTELPVLARHRAAFAEQGVHVWVSDPAAVDVARDKRLTHRWLQDHDLPAPEQRDLQDALDLAERGGLRFPVIAKPARGSSSVGLSRVADRAGLLALDPALDLVVESVAPGVEHTVDVWVDQRGRCRAAVPRRRLETRAGEVSKGLTVRDPEVVRVASAVAEALPGARGVLNVQLFQDAATGRTTVIEVNARFGGGFPLTWAAGGRFPTWVVQDLEGGHPDPPADDWQDGLLMLRYDQGVYLPAPPS